MVNQKFKLLLTFPLDIHCIFWLGFVGSAHFLSLFLCGWARLLHSSCKSRMMTRKWHSFTLLKRVWKPVSSFPHKEINWKACWYINKYIFTDKVCVSDPLSLFVSQLPFYGLSLNLLFFFSFYFTRLSSSFILLLSFLFYFGVYLFFADQ